MDVFTQDFQNFPSGLSPFTYQELFIAAGPLVDPGQGLERKQLFFLPPLHSWYLTGSCSPVTKDPAMAFLLEGLGGEEECVPQADGTDRARPG